MSNVADVKNSKVSVSDEQVLENLVGIRYSLYVVIGLLGLITGHLFARL